MSRTLRCLLGTAAAITLHGIKASAFTSPPPFISSYLRHSPSSILHPRISTDGVLRACQQGNMAACYRPKSLRHSLVLSASASDTPQNASSPVPETSAPVKKSTAVPGKAVMVLCALGCVLGLYALYVGNMANAPVGAKTAKGAAASGFKAWCDFSTGASCSTVARSQYGVGLGLINAKGPWGFLALPNALYGIFYYIALFLTQLPSTFSLPRARQIALILSSSALLASVYLGYLLVFVIKNLCVVCLATYLVNAALFKLSLADYQGVVASFRRGGAGGASGGSTSVGARAKGLVLSDRVARGDVTRRLAAEDESPDAASDDKSEDQAPTTKDAADSGVKDAERESKVDNKGASEEEADEQGKKEKETEGRSKGQDGVDASGEKPKSA